MIARRALLSGIGLALALLNASLASAGTDIRVELTPIDSDSEAGGVAVLHEQKKGTLLDLEVRGLTPGPYVACLVKAGMETGDHLHFGIEVGEDGKGEVRLKFREPPSAFVGGYICVGSHGGAMHDHILMGTIGSA